MAQRFPALGRAVPALKSGIRTPTMHVLKTTAPMAFFQVGGHAFSSISTSKIPVSLVHTIKALSPTMTVAAYRILYKVKYSKYTYMSLVPLTLGVALACSGQKKMSGSFMGIAMALAGTVVFVIQNIWSKKLFNEAARAESETSIIPREQNKRLDKLNLLCYSSGLAFIATVPMWLWAESPSLFGEITSGGVAFLPSEKTNIVSTQMLVIEFIFNGSFHFAQNILAFVLLAMVSPVTYSVASLVKRIFIILTGIFWFQQDTNSIQAVGLGLTFLGLYLYDRFSDADKADRRARIDQMKQDTLLPLSGSNDATSSSGNTPLVSKTGQLLGSYFSGLTPKMPYSPSRSPYENKKDDAAGPGRTGPQGGEWLPPGTKQDATWKPGENIAAHRE
jgi:solute carrier family 35, member E1